MKHGHILLATLAMGIGVACGDVVVTPENTSGTASTSGSTGGAGGAGGGTTDATGTGGFGGGPFACSSPNECPASPSACATAACTSGVCGLLPAPAGASCPEGVCDGNGDCVECVQPSMCPNGGVCVNNSCVPFDLCTDGIKNGDETDVDCGGSCPPCPTSDVLIISEVRTHGANGDGYGDDFVELYNPGDKIVILDASWRLHHRSAQGACQGEVIRYQGNGQVIGPHKHFLIVGLGYQQATTPDAPFLNVDPTASIADAGSLWIEHGGKVADALCYYYDDVTLARVNGASCPSQVTYLCEGMPVSNLPHDGTSSAASASDASLARKLDAQGKLQDTGDNLADFAPIAPADPQGIASPAEP